MAWDDPATHPARPGGRHRNGATGFARLEVAVPEGADAITWLGGTVPAGVVLRPGLGTDVGPRALVMESPAGPILLG